jgi:hypothetical protein
MANLLTIEMIDTAIQEVLINQSYEIHGRRYTRADLDSLRMLRKELRADLQNGFETEPVMKKGAYRAVFK